MRFTSIWLGLAVLAAGCVAGQAAKLVVGGDTRDIYERPDGAPESSPDRPGLLVLAFDGVGRDLLYEMLRKGELPEFAKLLHGTGSRFPHAHFEERYLSTLPSTTIVAWVTAMTGATPAEHGVAGNEFFIRETRQFAAPVPVTFGDPTSVLATYTEEYVNKLTRVPSVYQQIRKRDPNASIWVAMHQLHSGADTLLVTDRAVLAEAFGAFLETTITEALGYDKSKSMYAALDAQVVGTVVNELGKDDQALPDVLTVYLSGTDQFAHTAEFGPDRAIREYLKEEIEPQLEKLRKALEERGALANRYVVVTADHGHTQVVNDDAHALAMDDENDPPAVLRGSGFRVRPFQLDVADDHDFSAVLAYQGAMAYVYVADRSTCATAKKRCDFSKPPRFEQDVLAVAEAFHAANETGKHARGMKGTLDLILARRPKPARDTDAPFEVYVGEGKLVPIGTYMAQHPHPTYVDFEPRMRDLAVGRYGERAGDVLLVANNGNKQHASERYYFSGRYHSWHGSPSKLDSEIPLIVAHPERTPATLQGIVTQALGNRPYQQRLTNVLLALRLGPQPTLSATRATKVGSPP